MTWLVTKSSTGQDVFYCFQPDKTISCVADEANPYYQQYLEWLAEGNTPEEWNPNGSV